MDSTVIFIPKDLQFKNQENTKVFFTITAVRTHPHIFFPFFLADFLNASHNSEFRFFYTHTWQLFLLLSFCFCKSPSSSLPFLIFSSNQAISFFFSVIFAVSTEIKKKNKLKSIFKYFQQIHEIRSLHSEWLKISSERLNLHNARWVDSLQLSKVTTKWVKI